MILKETAGQVDINDKRFGIEPARHTYRSLCRYDLSENSKTPPPSIAFLYEVIATLLAYLITDHGASEGKDRLNTMHTNLLASGTTERID